MRQKWVQKVITLYSRKILRSGFFLSIGMTGGCILEKIAPEKLVRVKSYDKITAILAHGAYPFYTLDFSLSVQVYKRLTPFSKKSSLLCSKNRNSLLPRDFNERFFLKCSPDVFLSIGKIRAVKSLKSEELRFFEHS